jgi:Bacterial extracellular solute-binding proteins, family 5 Middle/Binding-prot-dependent transport system membrane comp, N-term
MRILPGNPAVALLEEAATPEALADIRQMLGLDKLLIVQYGTYLCGAIQGILAAPSPLTTRLPLTSRLRWTFSLRRGIQFHKGFGELKADDVVFSFHRVLDPKTCGPMRSIIDIVKDIKALDEYTV